MKSKYITWNKYLHKTSMKKKKKKVFLPINYVPYFGGKKYFFYVKKLNT